MRFLIGAILLAATAAGWSQEILKIEFSSEGPREVWIDPTATPGRVSEPLAVNGTSVELPLAGAAKESDSVNVRDVTTGKVARKPLKGLASPWKPVTSEYTRLYQLDVDLQHEGKPVAFAVVKLEAGADKRQEILDQSGKGIATFYNLGPGPYRIVAEMKSGAKTVSTPAQTFNPTPSDGTAPKLTIAVNDDVQVIEPTTTEPKPGIDRELGDPMPGGEQVGKGEKEGGSNPVGTIIGMILGLGLLGGIGYGIYRYLQTRGAETEAQLAKLGLGGQTAASPDPATSAPATPAPLQKIVLGDAAPTPLGTAAPAPSPVGSVVTPRLVQASGDVVLLAEGENEIGREAGISFPGETSLSRRHASVSRIGDAVVVTDLGSTNGTWVNGRKIDAPTPLQPGDQIMFGKVTLRYEV